MLLKEFNKEVLYTDQDLTRVSKADIALLKQKALANDRKRIRLCSHKNVNDPLHEMLIIHTKDTYVRPHKHLNKSESFHVIEGSVDIVIFDEQGEFREVIPMGEYSSGRAFYYRMETALYHTLLIHSDFLVFHEITKGPFHRSDTVFAPWAPQESDPEACGAYLRKLMKRRQEGPEKGAYRGDDCRLCGSRNIKLVMPLPSIPIGDDYVPASRKTGPQKCYPMNLSLCEDCGLAHLREVVDPELIYRNHYLYETTVSPGLVEHFQKYAEDVLERIKPPEGGLIVEMGSNDGTLLKVFRKAGLRVLGVDPAREIAQRATQAGIETWSEFFTFELSAKIKKEKGTAGIVIANNVLANIDDLEPLVKGIRNILSPDGVFIFETGYLIDSVRNLVFDNIYHEHISYFSVKPLETFFKKHGMELVRVDRVGTKGGSIRGTVQLKGGSRKVESSVGDLVRMEIAEGFYQPARYQLLSRTLGQEKEKLQTLLKEWKAKGKKIAGYGASLSVTTFIYYFEIADFINFIVDDNPRKHDTLSPGYQIPVLDPKALYAKKPDYIIIMAWRFADLIVKKHPEFLAQGGHFVVPLPSVKVI